MQLRISPNISDRYVQSDDVTQDDIPTLNQKLTARPNTESLQLGHPTLVQQNAGVKSIAHTPRVFGYKKASHCLVFQEPVRVSF